MKNTKITLLILILLLTMTSCSKSDNKQATVESLENNTSHTEQVTLNQKEEVVINEIGMLYLYGEQHGKPIIIQKELELWKSYYHEDGMRHLFMELPYFTAELLNIWISEESDDRLLAFDFTNWGADQELKDFYRAIKAECPETVFHGTDIGHGYLVDGIKFRHYLEDNDLVDTDRYLLNEASIMQKKEFDKTRDDTYRESMMVENFVREFNTLENQSVMGIYGSAHISLEPYTMQDQTVETMASQLSKIYMDRLVMVDLTSEMLKDLIDEPLSQESFDIAGKTYQASYFGKLDHPSSSNIEYIEYWRLNNAYEDFKSSKLTGQIALYNEYPMVIEKNQIYRMTITLKNNTTMTMYSMSDGEMTDNLLITKEIIIND